MDEQKNNEIKENIPAETSSEENTIDNSLITEEPKKRPFWQSFRFISYVIGLIILIAAIAWLVNAFGVYRNATTYKKSHDIAVKELQYCDRIEGTTQSREIFNYCDQLKEKFKEVQR